jgi:uroporphyrin-III C-methyltransferase / precorrin-2 dehydrogenase / sirohydrochlorin ferrochelatase
LQFDVTFFAIRSQTRQSAVFFGYRIRNDRRELSSRRARSARNRRVGFDRGGTSGVGMRHFPIFLDLRGRRALVLGAGDIAARKAEPLRQAGAEVRISSRFDAAELDGMCLAVGADAPDEELRALSQAAQARGIPVNIVDRPDLCSFIMPAIVDRAPITIAVSSAGAAPILSRMLRAKIEALIPPAYGRLAALADRFKTRLRAALPDLAQRRRTLERLFTGPAADLVFAGQEDEAAKLFEDALRGIEHARGMVFLVGAGPGAADLMTLRAQRLLGEADVIVHDRLIGEAVLDLARRDARRIYVGKVRAHHCVLQEDINDLLIGLAREGKKVVRLKGGDPFVFGRGGEEAEALHEAGVPFEVVPGVTAALACAAQARIPLTHRATTRAVTLVTGHTKEGRLDLEFEHLVGLHGTIAVYMGIVSLPQLRDGLFAHGLDPATPAMLIERGGSHRQRELRGTLDELAEAAPTWTEGGPTLVMIGQAVGRGIALQASGYSCNDTNVIHASK